MAVIYGIEFADHARSELMILMSALIADTAALDSKFSYAYNSHDVAALQLNAVSVDFDSAEFVDDGEAPNMRNVYYRMTFSIRAHTDYAGEGQIIDRKTITELLFSINNKLRRNFVLNDDASANEYRLLEVGEMIPFESFEESGTVGGYLTAAVHVDIQHPDA